MIAACPKCDARYRVDEAKLGSAGARLRCAKCEAVFRVRAPQAAAPAVAEATQPDTDFSSASAPTAPAMNPAPAQAPASEAPQPAAPVPSEQPAAAPVTAEAPAESAPTQGEYDRDRLVLVADPNEDAAKQLVSTLESWGVQTILVHDGVEAMLAIQRTLPRVVVLDAALPKMYGFQVCEVVKRNESLRDTKVVLVGAIHNRDRYRRPPVELYGADIYLEQPDLPDGMHSLLVQFGLPVRDPASSGPVAAAAPAPEVASAEPQLELATPPPPEPAPSPVAAPAAQPVVEPAPAPAPDVQVEAPAPAASDDGLGEEREKAERLARIVVSDIILYQGERFEEAIRAGNLLEALDSEIEEGRSFFRQRISEPVRSERDFLVDEMLRVARERGMP
jgi:predicted Zn finger-like uncharacterized protein